MGQTLRRRLLGESSSFVVAGLVHRGVLMDGDAHRPAAIAESTSAGALLADWGLTWLWPAQTRRMGRYRWRTSNGSHAPGAGPIVRQ